MGVYGVMGPNYGVDDIYLTPPPQGEPKQKRLTPKRDPKCFDPPIGT